MALVAVLTLLTRGRGFPGRGTQREAELELEAG